MEIISIAGAPDKNPITVGFIMSQSDQSVIVIIKIIGITLIKDDLCDLLSQTERIIRVSAASS